MLSLFEKITFLFYPIIISIITMIILLFAYLAKFEIIVSIILILISLYLIKIVVLLISTIPDKIRSVNILLLRNQNAFNANSFEKYMAAPCGRQVVKISLKKMNMQKMYQELKNQYPFKLNFMKRSSSKIIFYKNDKII